MPEVERILLERNIPIPMRDGVVTYANVWRPAESGPVPAILVRTPYTKEVEEINIFSEPRVAAARGFAIVSQDVRGRGMSEGAFDPYVQEGPDGYDSVEHVAAMDWCSGDVVMAGNSYVGATQWLAAVEAPPSLRAIAPGLTPDAYDEGWTFHSGVLELGFIHSWIAGIFGPQDRLWLDDVERSYTARDELVELAPWSEPWFREPIGSEYWNRISIARRRDRVTVPAVDIGGWHDTFLDGTLRNFAADRNPLSRLIVGPWGHDDWLTHLIGDRNLGHAGSGDGFGLFDRVLEFYAAAIAGRRPALPRVSAYMLGAGRWLELETWPPADAVPAAMPIGPAAFTHDPSNPPPSLGGRTLRCNTAGGPGWGRFDQRPVSAHPGVRLIELGAPPARRLAGPVAARLATRVSGADRADWVCTLCLREPSGALVNVCEGIARADAAAGAVHVDLGNVCIELPPDASLALLVSGASYPRWEPLTEPAEQAIEAGALELHVLESAGDPA
jgi:hypothetical protein